MAQANIGPSSAVDSLDNLSYLNSFSVASVLSVKAQREPLTTDRRYKVGTIWLNVLLNRAHILTSVSNGSATWVLASPGASDVDTLTGDSGGAISPAGGNITLAGGTNVTTAGAGSTITFNLDAAITLATSVTSPIYTTSAADMNINAAANQNIIMQMGDAAGVQQITFEDSASSTVGSLDSDGNLSVNGSISMPGAATQLQIEGGAVTDFVGSAVLVAGTVTVANTNIAANDLILLSRSTTGGTEGTLSYTISAATSFTINSSSVTDTSTIAYMIVRQL